MRRFVYLCHLLLLFASLLVGCSSPAEEEGDLNTPPPETLEASFEIEPQPSGALEGTWLYRFDASSSSDPDGEIVGFEWDLAGLPATIDWSPAVWRGFGRNGSYDVSLLVTDDDGNTATVTEKLVIDDLPYDYWGAAPRRVNTANDGTLSDIEVERGLALSSDGRFVAFVTQASNLGPADENDLDDVYLKDMETGAVELISPAAEGNRAWTRVSMSADASYIAYTLETTATGNNTIYVRRRGTNLFELVANDEGYSYNRVVGLSADGRKLLFEAFTPGVAGAAAWLVDLDTDDRIRIGLRLDDTSYASVSAESLSADGSFVVYSSSDDALIENDTNGTSDVFITDVDKGLTYRVSETATGEGGDSQSSTSERSVSAGGRYVVFESTASNFPGSVPGVEHVYVKDLLTGDLELASANAFGVPANADSQLPSISDDGRFVAFGSWAMNLVPTMEPYLSDCNFGCTTGFGFVKDLETGRVVQVTMGMNDTVPNEAGQTRAMLSRDGEHVAFISGSTNLVPDGKSSDGRVDMYLAGNPLSVE